MKMDKRNLVLVSGSRLPVWAGSVIIVVLLTLGYYICYFVGLGQAPLGGMCFWLPNEHRQISNLYGLIPGKLHCAPGDPAGHIVALGTGDPKPPLAPVPATLTLYYRSGATAPGTIAPAPASAPCDRWR